MCSDIKRYLIRLLINFLKKNQGFLYNVLMFHTIIHTLFAVHLVRNSFVSTLFYYTSVPVPRVAAVSEERLMQYFKRISSMRYQSCIFRRVTLFSKTELFKCKQSRRYISCCMKALRVIFLRNREVEHASTTAS